MRSCGRCCSLSSRRRLTRRINREAARLLAYLDEPAAVAADRAASSDRSRDLKAQIHDAYCLRAMKNGWTRETKEQLWSWYQKSSGWEGGYSFQGYLDMMIQELVGLLDAQEKEQYLRARSDFRFRLACWCAGSISKPIRERSVRWLRFM